MQTTLSSVIGVELNITPAIVTLGIWDEQTLERYSLLFCNVALMVAKRDVVQKWGDPAIPRWGDWVRGLDWCMQAEKTIYKARGCPLKAQKIWNPWAEYRELDTFRDD